MLRQFVDDEQAAFPVFEAVLVAILIITTIIFFTSLQRPTTSTDQRGIDLGRLASDTLGVLQNKPISGSGCVQGATFKQWIGSAMNGSRCEADLVEKFVAEVLPLGTQFQIRFDNGIDHRVLVPFNSTDVPRAGKAAATHLNPFWLTYANITPADRVFPGMEVTDGPTNATSFTTPATIQCINSPLGTAGGPGKVSWVSRWQAGGATPRVPTAIPYGVWAGFSGAPDANGNCTYLAVGLPDGTTTNYGVYAIQLVVWFGA
jgi:hypothetical protein